MQAGLIDIGSTRQLFIDDYIIESVRDVSQVLNPAVKVEENPVLKPERPWEGNTFYIEKVYYDPVDERFKLRYSAMGFYPREKDGKIVVEGYTAPLTVNNRCLATSRDGIQWERPNLGLVEFQGSKDNNILPESAGMGYLYIDERDDPDRRFKGHERIGTTREAGMIFNLYTSPDGLEWTPDSHNPIIRDKGKGRWGPTTFMGWDPVREMYATFMENCAHRRCPLGKRVIGRAESPDGIHWTEPETILVPDDRDPVDLEFYALFVGSYENVLMGMLWNFRTTPAIHHPELVFSRDGVRFERNFREPFIVRGGRGDFDHISVFANQPLVHGDHVYFYYQGRNFRSTVTLQELGDRAVGAIGLAMLPRDGMVSIDGPKSQFGELVTRAFSFSGRHLYLNLDDPIPQAATGAACDVRVEILSANHEPIEAFSKDAVDPIRSGGREQQVSWKGNADVTSLVGRSIRLKFSIKSAKLYSFQFR